MEGHAEHAILSASGAHIWTVCNPAARFAECVENVDTDASKAGTDAHTLGDWLLRQAFKTHAPEFAKYRVDLAKQSPYYNKEMQKNMEGYRDFNLKIFSQAMAISPKAVSFLIEQRVSMEKYIPKGFGRMDFAVAIPGVLWITDYKNGHGKFVEVKGNPQLRIYALGVIEYYKHIYSFHTVVMSIYQPNKDNIASEQISVAELEAWGEDFLKPNAIRAFGGGGKFIPGDHCTFCDAKPRCKAFADFAKLPLRYEFRSENWLPDEGVLEALEMAPNLADWSKTVKDYALRTALKGKKWRDWMIAHGRSQRTYRDKEEIARRLLEAGYREDQIYDKELIGVTKMDNLIGEKGYDTILKGLVYKPDGAPTLVREDSNRPAFNRYTSEFENKTFDLTGF